VDDILCLGCQSCAIHHDDCPCLVVANKVELSQTILLTFPSFLHFHTFQNGGLRRVWDFNSFNMEESNVNEKE